MKDFNNFIFETVYDFWRYFLVNGHPISFKVLESIVADGDYNLDLVNEYNNLKTEYGKGFNNELETEIVNRNVRHLIEIQTNDFDFSLFGGIDVSNHSKSDFDPSTYKQISNEFAFRLDYYFYNHADFNILPAENLNKLLRDGFIFIYQNRFKSYSNSYGEFIESELSIFRQVLVKNNLDYVDIINTFQEDIFTAIQKEDMTKDDIIILKEFDYNLEDLNNENDYLNYLGVAFKMTSEFSAKKIRQFVLSKLKAALKARIEENNNEPRSPPNNWIDDNWNSIGLGKGIIKIASVDHTISEKMKVEDSIDAMPTNESKSKDLANKQIQTTKEKYKLLNENLEINGFRGLRLVNALCDENYNKLILKL